jgi:hypothetical protein
VTALELLTKADTALASAKRDLDAGDLDGAANTLLRYVPRRASSFAEHRQASRGKAWDNHCSIRSEFL